MHCVRAALYRMTEESQCFAVGQAIEKDINPQLYPEDVLMDFQIGS